MKLAIAAKGMSYNRQPSGITRKFFSLSRFLQSKLNFEKGFLDWNSTHSAIFNPNFNSVFNLDETGG
jgi:hypothetical protein